MISSYMEMRFPGNHPQVVSVRQYLLNTCIDFVSSGLADAKFVSELTSGSEQKFWSCISEALIAARLRGKSFGTRKAVGEGPDFLVMVGNRKVWIEVVCPEPIDVPADWLDSQYDGRVSFPHEAILLRWTSAIKAKADQLVGSEDGPQKGYLSSGLVAPDDAYVIAVNGCRLRSGPFTALFGISQLPFAVEAVFPVGPNQIRIDRKTLKVIGHGHQHRPFVLKQNRAKVPTFTFLNPRFNSVSAIWAVDLNGGSVIGNSEPTAVVHNPNAHNPLPLGFLSAEYEYAALLQEDELVLSMISTTNE